MLISIKQLKNDQGRLIPDTYTINAIHTGYVLLNNEKMKTDDVLQFLSAFKLNHIVFEDNSDPWIVESMYIKLKNNV